MRGGEVREGGGEKQRSRSVKSSPSRKEGRKEREHWKKRRVQLYRETVRAIESDSEGYETR